MKDILYTVAKGTNGEFIKAVQAVKGNSFFCPGCNSVMMLRKSGNTTKNSKRPHFAHKSLTPNCTPETALHLAFKNLLAKKIEEHINHNSPLAFAWDCQYCNEKHSGNLLKKIKSVEIEHNLVVCRPDIALLGYENDVFAVIEIVVTHKPDQAALNFYKENNIILIQINLTSDNDIDDLNIKIANPDFVGTCFNPKCKKCDRFQHTTKMTIVEGPCWKCRKPMKVAMTRIAGGTLGPAGFSEQELLLARSKGANIKLKYSKSVNEEYLANTCSKCGAFAGDFYLFQQYMAPAEFGELPFKSFPTGFHCEHCEEIAAAMEFDDTE